MPNEASWIHAVACTFGVLLGGCDEHDHRWGHWWWRPEGTLRLSWTIDGRAAASDCDALGANGFEAELEDHGLALFEIEAPCDDFEIEVEVPEGSYRARTRLVDAFDRSRTWRIQTVGFTVREGDVTSISVDFPSGTSIAPAPDAGCRRDAAASDCDAGE